jgi:putative ATP-dependent endonuclease of OLD family
MHLSSFEIKNLRSIEKLSITVPSGLMVLVGQNSSGKSNVFRGLELFCTGKIDQRPFSAPLDMPTWIIKVTAPQARTTIRCDFIFESSHDQPILGKISQFFQTKGIENWSGKSFALIRYFTRGGLTGFQTSIPGRGTRDSEGEDLDDLAYSLLNRIEYRYVPSLKDLQSAFFQQVNEELKGRLLSIWSGSKNPRKSVLEKREKFQQIRGELEKLIQDSSAGLSSSVNAHFPEVNAIKLAMASTDLEDLIGSLAIFAEDGSDTLLSQKGSGVQGASIIHMLRTLRLTSPKGKGRKLLHLWNIEEPETFLHPAAQRKLMKILENISQTTQLFLTTHSPLFVSRAKPQNTYLLERRSNAANPKTTIVPLPKEDRLKPIRESLGTSLSDSLALHEIVILVEGVSDAIIFQRAFERLCDSGKLNVPKDHVVFLPAHGASSQATTFAVLRSWSPLCKMAAIFDRDKAGKEAAIRIKGHVTEGVDFFFLPNSSTECVLEDLFPEEILDAARKSNKIAQTITTKTRPDGTILDERTDWNKEELAHYFCENASSADWANIEMFTATVVGVLLR